MKNLMGLYNEQTHNGCCLALCLLICMHVCIRTTQDFSLQSATLDSDFRSGQKWYISEIRLPAEIIKQTKEKWF